MEQRISLVTLGWKGASPDGEVVLFQAGGMVVALWSRLLLAEDGSVRLPA